jgi:acetyl esterase/lipase
VLYLHGGGMIVGSVAIFDGPVSRYVARTGVPMLSLEYRLAPEHPHPAPVEDAYAGLVWLAGRAAELGIDPGRIAVMGDSAGGGLAAGVAILSRDRDGPAVARQLLVNYGRPWQQDDRVPEPVDAERSQAMTSQPARTVRPWPPGRRSRRRSPPRARATVAPRPASCGYSSPLCLAGRKGGPDLLDRLGRSP